MARRRRTKRICRRATNVTSAISRLPVGLHKRCHTFYGIFRSSSNFVILPPPARLPTFIQHLPSFTQHLPNIYSTFIQHLHNIYTTFTHYLHNIYKAFTQHLLNIYPTFTHHLHNIYPTITQHLHNIYTAFANPTKVPFTPENE